jgi:hypothetical protein
VHGEPRSLLAPMRARGSPLESLRLVQGVHLAWSRSCGQCERGMWTLPASLPLSGRVTAWGANAGGLWAKMFLSLLDAD